jgi:hypothetical protein
MEWTEIDTEIKVKLEKLETTARDDLPKAYKDALKYQLKYALTPEEVYFKLYAYYINIMVKHAD